MSGHSHAKTIRHAKNITDQKRGQMFSKMARMISVAVKEGGPNPETNSKLRLAFEMAKKINMPKENIERAIKQAAGGEEGVNLTEVVFEAYGPGGIAIIIEGITDNKNRTLGEIKQVLSQNGGKLVGEGSVQWMFERKGCITIELEPQTLDSKKEELELIAIEAGAEDIYWHTDILDIYTKPEELEKVKKNLEGKKIPIESASLDWVAKEQTESNEKQKESCQKLFDALDENDAVQEIYSNLKV
ncbi:MAG: transcriptional regulator [Parcubacteria group bacterium CG2_30_36_18]|uniref:Probable transcriptional regulatory protein CO078_01415 n=4 Tax=Candidatus Nealsoniibacteriota TaxID=1817911 RepID=A0A2M8DLJ6_9BACT|nr:MAG: transcriptional regulator [Parcubacteria group bacterium CG2_30_36_18]PIP24694.1 MAG: YebC/PmpR family DNA-binding transcriptional regulator [Candidatus Nealsonbacteria bacterium CG23_combo_of_CG06-09_8_20_14_all_36_125]PIR72027.1 MAG: YebC/PmpR family DNA-binding transcriptional regulator [Candidatus Nealsonbacteria bacterium CG10_big_fil_rev_8_21_14_0_10_36_228]PIX88067.1 MAG: YebC/PmpR family DNA-binding transcriptional regulator [Candidatus Nealsonbacteria bacterium CG_4_10_14_3_um_f